MSVDHRHSPEKVEMKKTREGFGRALVDLGEKDPRIVVLVGDLTESTMVHFFAEKFPDRFIQVGIAEQNMCGVAAGLAAHGEDPVLRHLRRVRVVPRGGPDSRHGRLHQSQREDRRRARRHLGGPGRRDAPGHGGDQRSSARSRT